MIVPQIRVQTPQSKVSRDLGSLGDYQGSYTSSAARWISVHRKGDLPVGNSKGRVLDPGSTCPLLLLAPDRPRSPSAHSCLSQRGKGISLSQSGGVAVPKAQLVTQTDGVMSDFFKTGLKIHSLKSTRKRSLKTRTSFESLLTLTISFKTKYTS